MTIFIGLVITLLVFLWLANSFQFYLWFLQIHFCLTLWSEISIISVFVVSKRSSIWLGSNKLQLCFCNPILCHFLIWIPHSLFPIPQVIYILWLTETLFIFCLVQWDASCGSHRLYICNVISWSKNLFCSFINGNGLIFFLYLVWS